jgi:hypothetical protein
MIYNIIINHLTSNNSTHIGFNNLLCTFDGKKMFYFFPRIFTPNKDQTTEN